MKRASVTIFLSLCIGSFSLLITTLANLCVATGERVRIEAASDISMNSVLGEYSKALLDEYNLLYIDSSYLSMEPSIDNVKNRLSYYYRQNTEGSFKAEDSPWGDIKISDVNISEFQTATAGDGASLRYQAAVFVEDCESLAPSLEEAVYALSFLDMANELDAMPDPMPEWDILMGSLEAMPLPMVKGQLLPLLNPADWVYELSKGDVLSNSEVNVAEISDVHIDISRYISNRDIENTGTMHEIDEKPKEEFLTYINCSFGDYLNPKEDRLFKCEREYVISKGDSDYSNFKQIAERIYRWRFNDNLRLAKADGGLNGEALAYAMTLDICKAAPAFAKPIADSMIYACAYLETLSDIHALYNGGKIPVKKLTHRMNIGAVIFHSKYFSESTEGLNYGQYLAIMMSMLSDIDLNYRVMDLVEMNIRKLTGNENFKMDWCIECINVTFTQGGRNLPVYSIDRTYGLF